MATRVAVTIRTALPEERQKALRERQYSLSDVETLMKACKDVYKQDMKVWAITSIILGVIFGGLMIFFMVLGAPVQIILFFALIPLVSILYSLYKSGMREKRWLKKNLLVGYPEFTDNFEEVFQNIV